MNATPTEIATLAQEIARKAAPRCHSSADEILGETYLQVYHLACSQVASEGATLGTRARRYVYRSIVRGERLARGAVRYNHDAERMSGTLQYSALDAPIGDDGSTLAETLGAEDPNFQKVETKIDIEAWLDLLPATQRETVVRILQGHTETEVAAQDGVSQQAVSAKVNRALSIVMRRKARRAA